MPAGNRDPVDDRAWYRFSATCPFLHTSADEFITRTAPSTSTASIWNWCLRLHPHQNHL